MLIMFALMMLGLSSEVWQYVPVTFSPFDLPVNVISPRMSPSMVCLYFSSSVMEGVVNSVSDDVATVS